MHNPFTIKVELVRGCTQRCPFCALSTIVWRDDRWQFMPPAVFYGLVDDLAGWLPKSRMEFAERGEPSFHPKLLEYVRYAREKLPLTQMLLTTNGDYINKTKPEGYAAWIEKVHDAGVNLIMVDCYTRERYELMKGLLPDAALFFEDNVHPYGYKGNPAHVRQTILVEATPDKGQHKIRWLQNQGGNVDVAHAAEAGFFIPSVPEPLKKMCVRPFRELVIHNDGTIPLCCNDWSEEGVQARFPETGLREIWESKMQDARAVLLQKNRAGLSPCYKCSERPGMRVGLESGWFGGKIISDEELAASLA